MRKVLKRIVLLIIVAAFSVVWVGCTKETNTDIPVINEQPEGRLLVTVTDKASKEPVDGARIVVMGQENEYGTDEKGLSSEITMKVNKDIYKKYGGSLYNKAPAGSTTLLITKDGYKDYIVFNKAIYPGNAANILRVELEKLKKNDKQKCTISIQKPNDVWVEELINYSKNISEENKGTGDNRLTISIKDSSSKALEGVTAVVPELNLKLTTDKDGKCTLNLASSKEALNIYPVERDISEYTIVLIKEGYVPRVIFNAALGQENEGSLSFTLKAAKNTDEPEYASDYLDFESEWVEKVISSLKERVQE